MYYILIIEGKYKITDVAKGMRISDDTLYRYCRAEKIIPPGRVIDLTNVTNDVRFLRYYCEPCGYIPITKIQAGDFLDSIREGEINLAVFVGQAIEKIEGAYEDKIITKQEYKEIHQSLIRLRELEASLDEQIKGEVKG